MSYCIRSHFLFTSPAFSKSWVFSLPVPLRCPFLFLSLWSHRCCFPNHPLPPLKLQLFSSLFHLFPLPLLSPPSSSPPTRKAAALWDPPPTLHCHLKGEKGIKQRENSKTAPAPPSFPPPPNKIGNKHQKCGSEKRNAAEETPPSQSRTFSRSSDPPGSKSPPPPWNPWWGGDHLFGGDFLPPPPSFLFPFSFLFFLTAHLAERSLGIKLGGGAFSAGGAAPLRTHISPLLSPPPSRLLCNKSRPFFGTRGFLTGEKPGELHWRIIANYPPI